MKKVMICLLIITVIHFSGYAQSAANALQGAVEKLDKAKTVNDYESLAKQFSGIAVAQKTSWLPWYYAAFCDAKIGFFYQNDGERIEPYSNDGEASAKKALALLDTAKQKQETSEVYLVMSMVYRTMVFINPVTYGYKYGTLSDRYLKLSKRLTPDNPRTLYFEAWVKYNTPKAWGGDKTMAKTLAEQSLAKLAGAAAGVGPHWGKTEDQELLSQYK
ncbi:MAG TPA: hypothetical protein VJ844_14270 [Mucilaginibacter sp.]|nr:hypothetical protein [Mucilaginibacter sp.]